MAKSKSTTTKRKIRAPAATLEEWAATDFAPVYLLKALPYNDKEIAETILPIRIAGSILEFSKAELIERFPKLAAIDPDLCTVMSDSIRQLSGFVKLIEAARARLIIAGAAIEQGNKAA